MPYDQEIEIQGTDAARRRYRDATEAAVAALRQHAAQVEGRETFGPDGPDLARALSRALEEFTEAEFELAGSVPFTIDGSGDGSSEGDGWIHGSDRDEHDPGDAEASAFVILEHRVQLAVLDEPELITAARGAYRQMWPEDTEADAEAAVAGVSGAIGEILHAHGWDALLAGTEYLEPRSGEVSIVEVDDLPDWIPPAP